MSIYVRITRGENSENPTFLAELARQKGWGLVREICDLEFSDIDSKELLTLMEEARRGEVEIIYINNKQGK